MNPVNSRSQERKDFAQAQPYVVGAPVFQANPYYAKYDITKDPRNVAREMNTAVVDEVDRGVDTNPKMFGRSFDSRFIPLPEMEKERKRALDD